MIYLKLFRYLDSNSPALYFSFNGQPIEIDDRYFHTQEEIKQILEKRGWTIAPDNHVLTKNKKKITALVGW